MSAAPGAGPSAGWERVPADDALAIGTVLVRCARLVDVAAWDDLDLVFTEDAVVASTHGTAHGTTEFVEVVERARAHGLGPHHITDTVLRRLGADRVRAWSKWFTVAADGTVRGGEQLDLLVRTPEGWRITERRTTRTQPGAGTRLGVEAFLG